MARPKPPRVRLASDGSSWLNRSDLEANWTGGRLPESEEMRRYYGASLTPYTIESVIRMAEIGYMRDLTDLVGETIAMDPNFSNACGKRFRALAAMEPRVVPATGEGIDERKAAFYADVVRQQLDWIPSLRQAIVQLDWGHCDGRSALEKVWRQNPGGNVEWRIEKLQWIHPRRLSFGPERELRLRDDAFIGIGFEARGLELRKVPSKFIQFLPQQFREYPEREGFGPRGLYWSFFKRFGQRERMILLEVFGKPWKVAEVDPAVDISPETLDDAIDSIEAMGANSAARLPKGIKLVLQQPGQNAGQTHREVVFDANDEIDKLILGQTRTSQAKPGALGSAGDEVAQDEQGSVVAADGWGISDALSEQLAADIILMNYGPGEIDHAPRIELKYELPPDRTVEIDRVTKVLSIPGVELKKDEVYERIGFTRPQPGDEVFVGQAPAASPFGAPAPSTEGDPLLPDASPLGEGGEGEAGEEPGDEMEDDSMTLARAIRVLSLVERHKQQTARRVR